MFNLDQTRVARIFYRYRTDAKIEFPLVMMYSRVCAMITASTPTLVLWTAVGGMISSVMSTAVMTSLQFFKEIAISATGLQVVHLRGALPHTAHNVLSSSVFGLKKTFHTERASFRYGMFISIRHRFYGTFAIEPQYGTAAECPRFVLTIWSFRDVMPILYASLADKIQITLNTTTCGHQNIIVAVPKPNAWQQSAIDYVNDVNKRKTSTGLVMLITGHGGCGKSTFPKIFAHSLGLASVNYCNFGSMAVSSAISDSRSLVVIDEVDSLLPIKASKSGTGANWSGSITGKNAYNQLMDAMHDSVTAGYIIMTSNKTLEQLRDQMDDLDAAVMLRRGRIDIVFHITPALELQIVQDYQPIANNPPLPVILLESSEALPAA